MLHFVCIADMIFRIRGATTWRNRHVVAWSAELLVPNTVMMSDRVCVCVMVQRMGVPAAVE